MFHIGKTFELLNTKIKLKGIKCYRLQTDLARCKTLLWQINWLWTESEKKNIAIWQLFLCTFLYVQQCHQSKTQVNGHLHKMSSKSAHFSVLVSIAMAMVSQKWHVLTHSNNYKIFTNVLDLASYVPNPIICDSETHLDVTRIFIILMATGFFTIRLPIILCCNLSPK